MIRTLTVVALVVALSTAGVGAANADEWLTECNIWHGEQYCRQTYTKARIPTTGELREKGRPCATAWADRRRNCEGQA